MAIQWIVLAGVISTLSAVVVFTYSESRPFLAFAVGATGGLVDAQLFRVHAFTFAVAVWALYTLSRERHTLNGRAVLLLVCSGCLAVTTFTGDLVNSSTLGFQLMALAASAGVIAARSDPHDRRRILEGLLASASLGSLVALLQVTGIISIQLWHPDVSSMGRPLGIYPEPDWLGMYSAIGLVIAWRLVERKVLRSALVALNGATFVIAFARGAWLALAVSVAVVVVIQYVGQSRQNPKRRGGIQSVAALSLVGIVLIIGAPGLRADLINRIAGALDASNRDVSAQARVEQTQGLLKLAQTAPLYGHGLSSSGRVGVSGRLEFGSSLNNVGSNWLLSMWVDGKLLAIPLIGFIIITAARQARSIAGQVLIVAIVSSLFSNATFMPIVWLALGVALASDGSRPNAAVGEPSPLRNRIVGQAHRSLEPGA